MSGTPGSLSWELAEMPSAAALAAEWTSLEAASDASFFLSWNWIGCWIRSLPATVRLRLLRVSDGSGIVGLAVFCVGRRVRGGVLRSKTLVLHATGHPDFDELTIQYNGLLSRRGYAVAVAQAAAQALLSDGAWEEVYLDGCTSAQPFESIDLPAARLTVQHTSPARYVDLQSLRERNMSYLESLTSRTRSHVLRSFRHAGKLGPLELDIAGDAREAAHFMQGLKALHQTAWQAKGQPGSFANAHFGAFHAALVQESFDAGVVQVARIRAGDHPIGYLYNFVYRHHVYAYQTGFDFKALSAASWSPGLICHVLAIERNRELGHRAYDFLAGDSRYKRQLANCSRLLQWTVVRRPKLKFQVYDWLRQARMRLAPVREASRQ